MAIISKWADVEEKLGGPTEAEEALRAACAEGELCYLEPAAPDAPLPRNRIRAEVLRYFILGGCADSPIHGAGVELHGAWVDGALDLEHQVARRSIALVNCYIGQPIIARSAHLGALYLSGCQNLELEAANLHIDSSIFIRNARCTGAVSLCNGLIGGNIEASGAALQYSGDIALNAQGARIEGGVFLRDARCSGSISFSGADVRGDLDTTGAHFDYSDGIALDIQRANIGGGVFLREAHCLGSASFSGALIGRYFDATDAHFKSPVGFALNLENARIDGGFYLRGDGTLVSASLDNARVGLLADDLSAWPVDEQVNLDGFVYGSFAVAQPDLAARLDWLRRGSRTGGAFYPQPYTQYAKVMRDAGHDAEARAVLYYRDRSIWRDVRARRRVTLDGSWGAGFRSLRQDAMWVRDLVWDHLLRWVVGYGHKPFRSVAALFGLFLAATTLAHLAWETGRFAPASDVILSSRDWADASGGFSQGVLGVANPAATWSETTVAGRDWQSFNRYIWAADLVIPLVPFGQVEAWQPSAARGGWGWWLWALSPVLNIAGWIVTALGAAAVTGIVRRD